MAINKNKKENKKTGKGLFDIVDKRIGTIASIITIIFAFISENLLFRYIILFIVLIYLMSIGIYIVRTVFSTNKARNELYEDFKNLNKKISKNMHKYLHNLRDYSGTDISTKDVIKDKCQNVCDYVSEFYKDLYGKYIGDNSISVCIKLIKTESVFDDNYKNWEMETIARSASTDQERHNIDSKVVKVSENSDFEVIISDNHKDELFSFADMRNIEEDFLYTYKIPYTNSRGDTFLDYYKSTIVVPIKIDGKFASNELKLKNSQLVNKNLYLGFLCIDSLKVFDTAEELGVFNIGVEYAKGIGDSLYIFLEKILIYSLKYDTIKHSFSETNNNKKTYNKRKQRSRRKRS